MTKYIKVSALGNDIEYEKIGENEVRFHRRWKKVIGYKFYDWGNDNYSHYHGTIIIPESVRDVKGEIGPKGKVYTVTELGTRGNDNGAFFFGKEVNEVSVPGTVKVIFDTTFVGCTNMHKVTLNEGIEEIEGWKKDVGGGAFRYCENLHNITIPDSVKKIGELAFFDCKFLTEITIGKSMKTLYGTFKTCKRIEKVTCRALEPPVLNEKTFEDEVYANAELFVPFILIEDYNRLPVWRNFKKISYYDTPPKPVVSDTPTPVTPDPPKPVVSDTPTPVTPDPPKPVVSDTPTPVTVDTPKSEHFNFMESGINYWVKDANAKVVYVTNKSQGRYNDIINIPQMVLHEGITYQVLKIGNYAFKNCKDLYAVSIPNTIKGVNDYAFADTPQLRSIRCYATTPPEVKPKGFDKVLFDKITLYVPKDKVSAYKSAEGWKNFVNILPLDS